MPFYYKIFFCRLTKWYLLLYITYFKSEIPASGNLFYTIYLFVRIFALSLYQDEQKSSGIPQGTF